MPSNFFDDPSHLEITLRGVEDGIVSVSAISSFLRDFNTLYTILRITTDPYYDYVSLDNPGYRVVQSDKLYVRQLSIASPFVLVAVAGLVAASVPVVWGLVQTVEKISTLPLDRKKKKLEIENLELDIAKKRAELKDIGVLTTTPIASLPPPQRQLLTLSSVELEQNAQPETLSDEAPNKEQTASQNITPRPKPVIITNPEDEQQILDRIEYRGGWRAYDRVTKSLRRSPIQIRDIEIGISDPQDD